MKQLMNVVMFLSQGVSAGRDPAPMQDGRENFAAAFWMHLIGVDASIEPSAALVSFERHHDTGGEFSLRKVRLENIRAGLDDRYPTLVLCSAGKSRWLSKEVSEGVTQLGKPDVRYGSVVILPPGEIASGAMYRRPPRHAQVLGCWQAPGASDFYVITSGDADLGEPQFESVSAVQTVDEMEARGIAPVGTITRLPPGYDTSGLQKVDGPVKPVAEDDGYDYLASDPEDDGSRRGSPNARD